MKVIKVSGTGDRRELAEHIQAGIEDSWLLCLERGDPGEEPASGEEIDKWLDESGLTEGAPVVIESNELFAGLPTAIAVFITDAPIGSLDEDLQEVSKGADLVLVQAGQSFATDGGKGIEAAVKEATGAGKVLVYQDTEERGRAFAKALDMTVASLGEDKLPEEITQDLKDAALAASSDGRMTCEQAHKIASDMGVDLALVGRALDLLNIKITRCQLGCF
jgi:hypothetical protein